MVHLRVLFILFAGLILTGLLIGSVKAQDGGQIQPAAIITPPTVEDEIIYFFSWPDTLYAFDESENELKWSSKLDPLARDVDPLALPAPAPYTIRSYVLLHIGRQLWGISKVDGRPVWSVDGLPEASDHTANRDANHLPGFYAADIGTFDFVLTFEQDATSSEWFLRRRLLGDGSLEWEMDMEGIPRGWWYNRDGLWISYEMNDLGSGMVMRVDPDTGTEIWSSDIVAGDGYRSAFIGTGRIFLMVRSGNGEFWIRAYNLESGELYRTIDYEADELIDVLQSGDKLAFIHRQGSEEQRLVRFLLYYTSLNPIRAQTIRESRLDQAFSRPVIEGNLLLYGGKGYSVFDGNTVWSKNEQMLLVEWVSDDYNLFIWQESGRLISWDILTGAEIWNIPFNVLPEGTGTDSNFSGASLTLIGDRLFAATPMGELIRIDKETGEPNPGIIKISLTEGTGSNGTKDGSMNNVSGGFIWIWILLVIAAGIVIVWLFKSKPKTSSQ